MLEIIKDNTITYNTELYRKYNLYLIDKYKEFFENNQQYKYSNHIHRIIIELEDLLNDNNSNDITKILNVTDWEEHLIYHYSILKYAEGEGKIIAQANAIVAKFSLNSIEIFLRKLKLEKLNEIPYS